MKNFKNTFTALTGLVATALIAGCHPTPIAHGEKFYGNDDATCVGKMVQAQSSAGAKDAVMTAHYGAYDTRRSLLEAHGDVVVNSVDGRTLTTPFLRFDQRTNQISSDSAFTLKEPGRDLVGVGFRSDADMQNFIVTKVISSKAGAVVLPEK